MYRVIEHFTDLHDKNHPYNVGDIFPREGVKVAKERLEELAGTNNKQGKALIEEIEDEQPAEDGKPAEGENDAEGEKTADGEQSTEEDKKPKKASTKKADK